ncbi:beta-galactosidase/beta-glucuronidase [Rhizobium mongolense]|uniref:Beta-galactosidase/beta-glucuronidase n=1 Tax=Rhizobium mongolense TaxID=57676 RepID=A0A7W6RQP2_9HYPH|nr:beta-galactosidase/beta-glucuronidase [Rhizobium mongolense]
MVDIRGDTLQSDGWTLVLTDAGACASPSDLSPSAGLIPAPVPGTVAEALEKAGLFDREHPHPLNDRDGWYLCRLVDVNAGDAVLRLEGLATLCEVFLNSQKILVSESMFETHDLAVHLHGGDELALCFRALEPGLGEPGPRARWRPQMITPQGLRLVRTTLLGHMPGWCPEIQAVGPRRPVSLLRPHKPIIRDLSLRSDLLEDGEGRLYASLSIEGYVSEVTLRCGEIEQAFERDSHGHCKAILKVPGVTPWWPRTHGRPHLHEVTLIIDDVEHPLGRAGFRRLAIDRGADGRDFGLLVNGERIFCRGAVWTTADIVRLPGGRDDYEPWLRLAAEADMNMVRIGGTMAYETPVFFRLCDEFGLLVWQDFMFANFDYHYLRELYGFESDRLRREDPDLYLALSQAVTGEVAEECYAEWRRQGSGCNGALVWTLQDLLPGPGWGVIDSTGEPKPIWVSAAPRLSARAGAFHRRRH